MINIEIEKINVKPSVKPYSPIKLTVYGKMVQLTAGGSCGDVEGAPPGLKNGNPNKC